MSAPAESPIASLRQPGLAAALGFFWPGVGYLYAGRGRRGLLLLFLFPAAELGICLLAVLVPVPVANIAIPTVLTLVLHVLLARGAARAASEFRTDAPLPFVSRWYSCLAAVLLTAVVNLIWTHGSHGPGHPSEASWLSSGFPRIDRARLSSAALASPATRSRFEAGPCSLPASLSTSPTCSS